MGNILYTLIQKAFFSIYMKELSSIYEKAQFEVHSKYPEDYNKALKIIDKCSIQVPNILQLEKIALLVSYSHYCGNAQGRGLSRFY
jgi:hypothetical protein